MTTPTFLAPDGVYRSTLVYSTTMPSTFLTGVAGSSTATGMQVSLNGGAWTEDPDLILFNGTSWTVPNPTAFSQGLTLLPGGVNTVAVREISLAGIPSAPATASITFVTMPADVSPPSGLTVERKDRTVVLSATVENATNLRGVNFYASASPGGGADGYTRINLSTVSTTTLREQASEFGGNESEFLAQTGVDPLYLSVVGTQQNESGAVLSTDFSDAYEVPEGAERVRATVALAQVSTYPIYSFAHDRSARETSTPATVYVSAFAALPASTLLYYVATAVYFDADTQAEVETPFSVEVAASPLKITAQVGNFPVVGFQAIVRDTIASILRTNPQIRVDAGSVLRDTFIDPFAAEAERIRFLVDFLHRAQSFAGLLTVDDPMGTGTSVPVANSPYKTALKAAFRLADDQAVQDVIDRSFEALASNFGVFRGTGVQARGTVTFYTTRAITRPELIPVGSVVGAGSVQFTVVQAASLRPESYDPTTRRYAVSVAVQATTPGVAGNVGAGQVRRVVSGPTGLSVTNASPMFGGSDTQTNARLAAVARNALASVDSGTRQGYVHVTGAVPGVERVNVVAAGDDLMWRDIGPQGEHIGGKVDVWVQGSAENTVTDVFAFQYDTRYQAQFVVLGDPANFLFRVVGATTDQPLLTVLSLTNVSTGESFDVTGATITAFDRVQLDASLSQPTVTYGDVLLGSYRAATGFDYVFRRQPVTSVASVTGATLGPLSADQFALRRPNSPLLLGRSTQAGDFLRLALDTSNVTVDVVDESHVMVGEYPANLFRLGADELSIVVTNSDGTFTYATTGDVDGYYDYAVTPGTETTPTSITRVPAGRIADGETVLVSYSHGENFSVTYRTNQVPTQVQLAVDARRHVTADVVVKEAVPWGVALVATVVLAQGADQSRVDTALRQTLGRLFTSRGLGDALRQSDVIAAIEGVPGVSHTVVPLTQMSTADGTTVVLDPVRTSDPDDAQYIAAWSTPTVSVWLLTDSLTAIPVEGGGVEGDFHAVYKDEAGLSLVGSSPGLTLRQRAGQAYIVGVNGIVIPGYSDDATLIALGYTTQASIDAARSARTGSRVLVSLAVSDPPSTHEFAATYQVAGDYRVYDIDPGPCQYVVLNDLTVTYG